MSKNQFRKKPVVIEAMQFKGTAGMLGDVDYAVKFDEWIASKRDGRKCRYVGGEMIIATLEDGKDEIAKHVASPGDWIICGIQGELYPCKPDIFAATYEAVE